MSRLFVLVSSSKPQAARRAVLASRLEIDVAVISPSEDARETAAYAVDGRWVFTVEEPLLASLAFAESGADVLARLAQAMRGLDAYDARASLLVLDGLDVLGADVFTLEHLQAPRAPRRSRGGSPALRRRSRPAAAIAVSSAP